MTKKIRIGSRRSPLALVQVDEVLGLLQARGILLNAQIIPFQTKGDRDKKTSLIRHPADDFFTDALDRALLDRRIDVAIHSAKDLPQKLNDKLEIFALTKTLDDTDALVSPLPLKDLPARPRIGTSSLLRQMSLQNLRPDVRLVDVRGTIQERLDLVWAGKLDGVIVATCALKRLGLEALIKDILPWEGTPLQGQLAVVGRRGDITFKQLFEPIDVRRSYGEVVLVGAGPGDRELITVKGINALKRADCVFYDYLVDPALLAYAAKADHVYVGKRKGCHALPQPALSRALRLEAIKGLNVVRLKGGDPLIFGRGAEEIEYLRRYHIGVSVVPGVSSATGIPSSLGVPLTARGISTSVTFLSGHSEDQKASGFDINRIGKTGTAVFLMSLSKISQIVSALKRHHWPGETPMLVVSKGTRADQTVLKATLATVESVIRRHKPQPPALLIAGRTVDFYRPSVGQKTILFLGTHPQNYRALGNVVHWPMIQILPVKFSKVALGYFRNELLASDLVVVTSEHAVEALTDLFDVAQLKDRTFAAIGSHTAQALLDRNLHPKLVATEETSDGLFRALHQRFNLKGKLIVFPRSALPNPRLKQLLTKAGATVKEVAVYRNVKPAKRPLPKQGIDAVVFTSPSTVVNFLKDYAKIPPHWEILCKGPVSQAALKKRGYNAAIL